MDRPNEVTERLYSIHVMLEKRFLSCERRFLQPLLVAIACDIATLCQLCCCWRPLASLLVVASLGLPCDRLLPPQPRPSFFPLLLAWGPASPPATSLLSPSQALAGHRGRASRQSIMRARVAGAPLGLVACDAW